MIPSPVLVALREGWEGLWGMSCLAWGVCDGGFSVIGAIFICGRARSLRYRNIVWTVDFLRELPVQGISPSGFMVLGQAVSAAEKHEVSVWEDSSYAVSRKILCRPWPSIEKVMETPNLVGSQARKAHQSRLSGPKKFRAREERGAETKSPRFSVAVCRAACQGVSSRSGPNWLVVTGSVYLLRCHVRARAMWR